MLRTKTKRHKLPVITRERIDDYDKTDVTDRAVAAGWILPEGWRVLAWAEPDCDNSDPRDKGDVYCADVDEEDYDNPTRAFCLSCDGWIYKLDEDAVAGILATRTDIDNSADDGDADDEPEPGDWSAPATGITCPDSPYGRHEPLEPLAVRWWREGKWEFVGVLLAVVDTENQQWGYASLWGTEAGLFPRQIDRDTGEVTPAWIDPINGDYPVPELISEAMHEARGELKKARKARRPHVRVWRWLRSFPWRAGKRPPMIALPPQN